MLQNTTGADIERTLHGLNNGEMQAVSAAVGAFFVLF